MKRSGLVICLLFPLLLTPGEAQVISHNELADGVLFKLQTGALKVYVCQDNILRVTYCADSVLPSKTILTVNRVWGTPSFTLDESDSSFTIATSALRAVVAKSSSLVSFSSTGGGSIVSEAGRQVTPVTVNGVATHRCVGTFYSPSGEAIYGLGQHQGGIMNYKGHQQSLDQANKEIAMPIVVSSNGYGLLWDNYSKTLFDGTVASGTQYKFDSQCGEMIDYYVLYGPDLDTVVSAYRTATGTAPLFPKWAYGLFQSKNRYASSAELIAVKHAYRDNAIPVDCIVQDWFYWDPYPWGSNIMNPSYFPDPRAAVDSLHSAHIHTMISIWATFTEGNANYTQFAPLGALYPSNGTRHYYDPHNVSARGIYWQQVRDQLFANYGWDAWWADADEPDTYPDTYNRDLANTALGKGVLYHNTYPLMHTTSVYDGWRSDMSGKRLFTLSRCAFPGNQRNAAASWSGDISCTWNDFRVQIAAGLNFCMSGIPYWTTDIGGYAVNWGPTDWSTTANRELFVRWFEYGAFCPVFRIHGVDDKSLLSGFWDSGTRNILVNYDKLRYRLMPYIYSLAWKVTSENYTVMRHLIMDYRTDPNVKEIADQFMFGPSMMINPVSTLSARSRSVYLPAGDWYNFWGGDVVQGGGSVTVSAPLDTMPIFVKAGSIIPMGPDIQYASQSIDPLEIRVYRGADAKFDLYEDEGDSYDYETGRHSLIPFSYSESTGQLVIGGRQGTYSGMPNERTFRIVFVGRNHGTGGGLTPDCDTVVHYDGTPGITGVGIGQNSVPLRFDLDQNYPNPFNGSTLIKYQLPSDTRVLLAVFDVLGRRVATLVDERQVAGGHSVRFQALQLASGVYFYTLDAGPYRRTRKLLLLK